MNLKLNSILIKDNTNLRTAMMQLQKSSKKMLCVINKKKNLIGVVNDGDLRRSILRNLNLDTKVSKFMNKNPIVANSNYSTDTLKKLMAKKGIDAIPIVKNKKVINIVLLDDIILKETEKIDVIINAGGFGKRLKPYTVNKPKTMVNINNRPIIDYIIEGFYKKGFKDFTTIVHYKAKKIIDHLNKSKKINYNFVKEKKPLGTCGGLSLLNEKNLSENFILINSDIISGLDFNNLCLFHKNNKALITVATSRKKMQLSYGSIKNIGFNMKSIEEKPEIEFTVNAGIYVFNKSCLKYIKKNKKFNIPDLLNILKNKKKNIKIYPTNEYWFDIANKDDLKNCSNFLKKN